MKKQLILIFLAIANIACAGDKQASQKKVFNFQITLGSQQKTGVELTYDKTDNFACKVLGISWPENAGSTLWTVLKTCCTMPDEAGVQHTRHMLIKDFSDDILENPHLREDLKNNFTLPTALPDAFVQKLIKENGKIVWEYNNSTIHFALENSEESLLELGLKQKIQPVDPAFFPTSELERRKEALEGEIRKAALDKNTTTPSSAFSFKNILWIGLPVSLVGLLVWLWSKRST